MPFRDLVIEIDINTSVRDPISTFFVPILKESKYYDVAVGYFSTSWIRDAAEGIAAIAENGGRCRWVISPTLTKEDWELLSNETINGARRKIADDLLLRDAGSLLEQLQHNTRNTIAWLIADGLLQFKIAVPKNDLSGMFHAKLGIFTDEDNESIAFSGSYNMTGRAKTNWESIDIYSSQREGDIARIDRKKCDFSKIWEERDPNLEIYEPSDKLVQKFIKITEFTTRPYNYLEPEKFFHNNTPRIPNKFLNKDSKLRPHQEQAIKKWFGNNGRGILNMATGSGKTVTALSIATELVLNILKNDMTMIIVICVPYKHLAEQWKVEAQNFNFRPVMCYSNYTDWPNNFATTLANLDQELIKYQVVITVNGTFSGNKFQSYLSHINTNFLLIADEMHNLGAEKLQTGLPENAQFRLGLSATPKRYMDEEGTQTIFNYFGDEVIEYGIKEAIHDKTLTEYYYYPILTEFTEDEMFTYEDLSERIAQVYGKEGEKIGDNPYLNRLLIERARLKAGAENKLIKLKELLQENHDTSFNLIYVGDVKTQDERQIERVMRIVGNELGMRVRKFTSDEDISTRKEILEQFASGKLQAIVAIRCLDEGVDVPKTQNAYILASTTNPRQFIQRRGRVLRLAPDKKFARIYDFVTVPPLEKSDRMYAGAKFKVERNLVRVEMKRINEFAETAINSGEALAAVLGIKKKLNLLDI